MRRSGFTLIELLLALVLFGVAMVALYGGLRAGLTVYERDESDFNFYQELRLFLIHLERDLRNAIPYEKMPFQGSSSEISFLTWETEWTEKGGLRNLYRVTYRYQDRSIVRLREKVSLKKGERKEGVKKEEWVLLKNVQSWSLEFPFAHPKERKIMWQPSWGFGKTTLPRGISMRLLVSEAGTVEPGGVLNLERKILIPQGVIESP